MENRARVRVFLIFLLASTLLFSDSLKLYLKDGTYHAIREYQVQGQRIRYFSTERGEWEEIPVELVDLAKTERERKAGSDRATSVTRQEDEEEKAERAQAREIASIPMEPGAYYQAGSKIEAVALSDYQIITDKKRRALQMISPIPIIPGKATVVIKGEHARFTVTENRPSFYLRLAKEERFGVVRLTPKKSMRIVENISIIPVANQAAEERKEMATFEQQLAEGLYRVWPEKTLEPGEYALVEFSDKEDVNDVELRVWDFAVK